MIARVAIIAALLACAPVTARSEPRTRDGVQIRLAIGPGYAIGTLDTAAADSESSGVGVATQLAIGWTVRPGLVLGVGTFPGVTLGPDYDGVDAGGQHVSATGPFADCYLSTTGGAHAFAGALFTAGYLDGGDRDGALGFGWGATAGVGYDRFVADEWSVGALARVTAYSLHGVDDSIGLLVPAVLVSVTRH